MIKRIRTSLKRRLKFFLKYRVGLRLVVKRKASFDYSVFKKEVLTFVEAQRLSDLNFKYSRSASQPTLYSSVYACMTLSLIGEIKNLSVEKKLEWITWFDSFQGFDGLFYDQRVMGQVYIESDWWGARHLALHMVSSYTQLGGKPKHPFRFLNDYYDETFMKSWLDSFDWNNKILYSSDFDNKVMNIGGLLQYQRDFWDDKEAGEAIRFLKDYLSSKVNPSTGLWGILDENDVVNRSRVIQFAYHLLQLFFYDKDEIPHAEKIIEYAIETQSDLGGFGVRVNSSACEDIDSIDLMIRLSPYIPQKKAVIDSSLRKAFEWVRIQQVKDGGFVFRLYEPFVYGHELLVSRTNEGELLSTWFRLLSLAYLTRYLDIKNDFHIIRAPGYEY